MLLISLLVAVVAAALAAVAVGVLVAAHVRRSARAERQAAVDAALEQVVVRAAETLGRERDATVDTVLSVASDKLGDTVSAGSRELDLRSRAFEQRVADIGGELERIGELVTGLRKERAQQHGALVENLQAVSQANTALTQTTQHLREALASPTQRGQWGERMAEDVLRAAGFREGVNYRRQTALDSGSIPDITFLLPRDLELRMDVKFPVDNYLRVLEADTDHDRERFTRAFRRDVKARVSELAARDYRDARDTVDCVLLFIPNEAVFAFVHETGPGLLDEAMRQQVVLCSPSTLFAVLAVIRQAVDHFQLERASDEILRCLGGVTDQWQRFTDHLDKVEGRLETLTKGFNELQGVRRRQMDRQLGEIERLRADATPHDGPVPAGPGEKSSDDERAVEEDLDGEGLVARRSAGAVRRLPVTADREAG